MTKKQYKKGHFIGLDLAIGIPVGFPFGFAFDNIYLGIVLGLSVGLIIGIFLKKAFSKNPIYLNPKEQLFNRKVYLIALSLGIVSLIVNLAIFYSAF